MEMLNLAGDALGVCGIRPSVIKTITGKITHFKKKLDYGIIDNTYVFFMDVLMHSDNIDSMPDFGDYVVAEVIESKQETKDCRTFDWRCIKLVRKPKSRNDETEPKSIIKDSVADVQIDEIDAVGSGISMTENSKMTASFDSTGEQKTISLVVRNTSNETKTIPAVVFDHLIFSAQIECPELYKARQIPANSEYVYKIVVKAKICGTSKLLFNFDLGENLKFRRCITVHVRQAVDEDSFLPIIRSKAYTKNVYNDRTEVVKGVRPVASPHFIENVLERFEVPQAIFDAVLNAKTHTELDNSIAEILQFPYDQLNFDNYVKFFQSLMHVEESCLRHEFGKYNRDRAHFVRENEFLALKMHGNVLESRPSIAIGDSVYAKPLFQSELDETHRYQGFIHHIRKNRLLIKFSDGFHSRYNGEDYSLTFDFSRSKFIKLQNAVAKTAKKTFGQSLLFPRKVITQTAQVPFKMENGQLMMDLNENKSNWFNGYLNYVQKTAVMNVLRAEARPMPHIIFGPPGENRLIEIIS